MPQLIYTTDPIDHLRAHLDWFFGVPDAPIPPPDYRKLDQLYVALTGDDAYHAAICIGALKRDVFALLHEAAEYNVTIQFQDAKQEAARVGTGIVNTNEYDKNGDPLPQWTANLRKPKPLLRSGATSSASSSPDFSLLYPPPPRTLSLSKGSPKP